MESLKKNKFLMIILHILFAGLFMCLGAFGYWLYQTKTINKPEPSPQASVSPAPQESGSPEVSFYPGVSPQPTSQPVQSQTPSEWKTYSNESYGYSIKYPKTFKTQVLAADVGVKEAPSNAEGFFIYNPSLEEPYLNRYIDFWAVGVESTFGNEWFRSQTVIGGRKASKLVNSNQTSKFDIFVVELRNNQGVLEIYVSNTEDKKTIANQILSTLKFLD